MSLFFLVLSLFGFWMLKRGLDKLRVALGALLWPKAPLQHVSVSTRHHESSTLAEDTVHGPERAYYSSVDNGPFYTKVTRSEFYPQLWYAFEVEGKLLRFANADPWNAGGYSGSDVALVRDTHQKWAASGPRVAYDPKQPSRHFLGLAQFPVTWTLIELVVGWFCATGIAIFLSDMLLLAGQAEPTFGEARRSVFILIPPAVAALYLLLGRSRPAAATRGAGPT